MNGCDSVLRGVHSSAVLDDLSDRCKATGLVPSFHSLFFGSLIMNQDEDIAPQVVKITNVGKNEIGILDVKIAKGQTNFYLTGNTVYPKTLRGGESFNITVGIRFENIGQIGGTIEINTNEDRLPYVIGLGGRVIGSNTETELINLITDKVIEHVINIPKDQNPSLIDLEELIKRWTRFELESITGDFSAKFLEERWAWSNALGAEAGYRLTLEAKMRDEIEARVMVEYIARVTQYEAEASARLVLEARFYENEAILLNTQRAYANAFQAEATARLEMEARIGDQTEAKFENERRAFATQFEAVASETTLLEARVKGYSDAAISRESVARADALAAEAAERLNMQASYALGVDALFEAERIVRASAIAAEVIDRQLMEASVRDLVKSTAENESYLRATANEAIVGRLSTMEANYASGNTPGVDTTARASIQEEIEARSSALGAEINARRALETFFQNEFVKTNASLQEEREIRSNANEALVRRADTLQAQLSFSTPSPLGNMIIANSAKVEEETVARVNALGALTRRVSTLETTSTGGGGGEGVDTLARAMIQDESETRANQDEALGRRIQTVEASYQTAGQVDERATVITNARVAEEATARALENAAMASRTAVLEASSRGGGNYLHQTEFVNTVGWHHTYNGMNLTMATQSGVYWNPRGESVLIMSRAGVAPLGQYSQVESNPFVVRPQSYIQFYAFTSSHRCRAWVSVFFYNEAGGQVGYAGENYAARYDNGGPDLGGWDQTGIKSYRVPDTATYAIMAWRLYSVDPSPSDPVGWFFHPYVGDAKAGQTEWNPYSHGSGKAGLLDTYARISNEETVRFTADEAQAARSSVLEAQMRGDQESTLAARIRDEASARATAVDAVVKRAQTLEAKATSAASELAKSFPGFEARGDNWGWDTATWGRLGGDTNWEDYHTKGSAIAFRPGMGSWLYMDPVGWIRTVPGKRYRAGFWVWQYSAPNGFGGAARLYWEGAKKDFSANAYLGATANSPEATQAFYTHIPNGAWHCYAGDIQIDDDLASQANSFWIRPRINIDGIPAGAGYVIAGWFFREVTGEFANAVKIAEEASARASAVEAVAARSATMEAQFKGEQPSALKTLIENKRPNLALVDWWKKGAAIPWVLNGGQRNEIVEFPHGGNFNSLPMPDGSSGDAWLCQASPDPDAAGGWYNGQMAPLDPDKTYRFMLPIAALTDSRRTSYWGTGGVCDLNTTVEQGNPYFALAGNLKPLRWHLFVGYIFPRNSIGKTHAGAGVWDMLSGEFVAQGWNYCFHPDGRQPMHRAYQFYADNGAYQAFGRPVVEVVDGTEAPIFANLAAKAAITQADARITEEARIRSSADEANASRSTTLEAQMNRTMPSELGRVLTVVDARIATEESTRATAVEAVARRAGVLESSFTSNSGMAYNGNFVTNADGWGLSNCYWVDNPGDMQGAIRSTGDASMFSDYMPINPLHSYKMEMRWAARGYNIVMYAGFQCFDQHKNLLGNIYMPEVAGQGFGWDMYERSTTFSGTWSPASPFYAASYNLPANCRFIRLMVLLNYQGQGTAGSVVDVDYVRFVNVTENQSTNARLTEEINTRAAEGAALATRAVALEARAYSGGNLVQNSQFVPKTNNADIAGWTFERPGPNFDAAEINWPSSDYYMRDENVLASRQVGTSMGGYAQWYCEAISVAAGDCLQYYVYMNAHRCDGTVFLYYYDAAGNIVGNAPLSSRFGQGASGNYIGSYVRIGFTSVKIPAGVAHVRLILRHEGTHSGYSDGYCWFTRPYVGYAREGQGEWNPFTHGGARSNAYAANARISAEESARVAADGSLATSINSVDANWRGANNDRYNEIVAANSRITSEASASAGRDGALTSRIDSVSATANGASSTAGIALTAAQGAEAKLGAARLDFTAVSPNGRVNMAVRSDKGSQGVDIEGGNLRIVGSAGGATTYVSGTGMITYAANGNPAFQSGIY